MSSRKKRNKIRAVNAKRVVVTTSWDDGHILDLKLSELLRKYAIKGTFYISPFNREFKKSQLLSKEQIVLLGKNFEIGAHTMTHPRLGKLRSDMAQKEIKGSKSYLEDILGRPVESFCYPGGCYNFLNVHQVRAAGFRVARTVKRFSFELKDFHELGTSVHAYNHLSDICKIARFAKLNPRLFLTYYRNWDILAMAMFDRVMKTGGVFHLWGHSWEIEKHQDWRKLERVLKYIARRSGVDYVENRKLL